MEVSHLASGPDTIAKEADPFGIESAIGDQQVQMGIPLEELPTVASSARGRRGLKAHRVAEARRITERASRRDSNCIGAG
jgi:hypothetical protein